MKKDNNKEAGGSAKKTARAPRSASPPAVEDSAKQEAKAKVKAGEKYMVRFTKPGQRAALMREAEKNFRSMNDEILFRVFSEPAVFIPVTEADIFKSMNDEILFRVFGEQPVVFIRVTEADINSEKQTGAETASGNGSYMVRFTKPGLHAALLRECERSKRSMNNEILFKVFGELVTPIDVTEAHITKESKDG